MADGARGTRYAIGVGSNRGDRRERMASAGGLLDRSGLALVLAVSDLLETDAVGGPAGQGPFLNAAWIVETALGPHQLLHLLQSIETRLGRTREVRWGARTIDLDLLLRDDGLIVASPVLTLPHPRLLERRFVLEPLSWIAGDWIHPSARRSVAELAGGAPPSTGRGPRLLPHPTR